MMTSKAELREQAAAHRVAARTWRNAATLVPADAKNGGENVRTIMRRTADAQDDEAERIAQELARRA